MLDLVLWSFAMATAPLVLALVWKLGRAVGSFAQLGETHGPLRSPEPWRAPHIQQFHGPSAPHPLSRAGRWW